MDLSVNDLEEYYETVYLYEGRIDMREYQLSDVVTILKNGIYTKFPKEMMFILCTLLENYRKNLDKRARCPEGCQVSTRRMPEFMGHLEVPRLEGYNSYGFWAYYMNSHEEGLHTVKEEEYYDFFKYYIEMYIEREVEDGKYEKWGIKRDVKVVTDYGFELWKLSYIFVGKDRAEDLLKYYQNQYFNMLEGSKKRGNTRVGLVKNWAKVKDPKKRRVMESKKLQQLEYTRVINENDQEEG